MTREHPTCEERIGRNLQRRLKDMRALMAVTAGKGTLKQMELIGIALEDDTRQEDAQQQWSEYPFCVTMKRLLVVELSTGGPADRFEVTLDEYGKPEAIVYIFEDWFDGARQSLCGENFDTAWDFLSSFVYE